MYDVIVIGGGHNGLTAAAALARAGRKVIVLERREILGGIAADEEFAPGFRTAGLLHDTTGVRPEVVAALGLERYGLKRRERPPSIFVPTREGRGLLLHDDPYRAAGEIAAFSTADVAAYASFRAFIDRVGVVLERFWNQPPPDLGDTRPGNLLSLLSKAWSVRRLGERDLTELLRIVPMPAADWLNERFESQVLKTALAAPGLLGDFVGPRSPGTSAPLLLHECNAHGGTIGGPAKLVAALLAACRDLHVEVRTSAEVRSARIANGQALGVTLADGETVDAKLVLASCTPQQAFLRLVDQRVLAQRLVERVQAIRARGTVAKLNLAIRGAFEFACRPGPVEFARIAPRLDDLERAFDAVKYRRFSEPPALDIYVPTVSDPSLAPPGHSVVSVLVSYAPYDLAGGWTDAARERLARAAIAVIEQHAPGLSERILARELLTPVDLELRYALTGGHVWHGERGLDQLLVRPVPECARYATPIEGLYLCGSGSHPGGGITCAPGMLAASAILERS